MTATPATIAAATPTAQRRKLIITRGLPASGKSTWALNQLARRPAGTTARVNRDDIRRMTQGKPRYDTESEAVITVIQHDTIRTLLQTTEIVIVDDTNLDDDRLGALSLIAHTHGADFAIQDFRDVDLDTCIERDRQRSPRHRVGEDVIRDMHQRYLAPQGTSS